MYNKKPKKTLLDEETLDERSSGARMVAPTKLSAYDCMARQIQELKTEEKEIIRKWPNMRKECMETLKLGIEHKIQICE